MDAALAHPIPSAAIPWRRQPGRRSGTLTGDAGRIVLDDEPPMVELELIGL
jgi:hypothetical protein